MSAQPFQGLPEFDPDTGQVVRQLVKFKRSMYKDRARFYVTGIQQGGYVLAEGDIVLDPKKKVFKDKAVVENWPTDTVHYTFREDMLFYDGWIDQIREAVMDEFNLRSAVTLIEIVPDTCLTEACTTDTSLLRKPHVLIYEAKNGANNKAILGYHPDSIQHFVQLKYGGGKRWAVHELCHALGLWHEFSRERRDEFIKVHFDCIKPEHRDFFEPRKGYRKPLPQYDYETIMAYEVHNSTYATEASKTEGLPIMSPIENDKVIRTDVESLSLDDVLFLDILYDRDGSGPRHHLQHD